MTQRPTTYSDVASGGNMDPRPLYLLLVDGLLVPPGKASNLLTDYLITG